MNHLVSYWQTLTVSFNELNQILKPLLSPFTQHLIPYSHLLLRWKMIFIYLSDDLIPKIITNEIKKYNCRRFTYAADGDEQIS